MTTQSGCRFRLITPEAREKDKPLGPGIGREPGAVDDRASPRL